MDAAKDLLAIDPNGNVMVVGFRAPYVNDTGNLEDLEDAMRELLVAHNQRFILLDLAEVQTIVSRMINSLLLMVKRVRADGGQVHLCGMEPAVERVFKTMKLDRVFDVYEDRREGLTAMQALERQLRTAQFA